MAVPDLASVAVPDLSAGAATTTTVTDEDRNRYGVLLDRAAERGLLGPVEYQARLVELADATTEEELRRIVTELPAFADPVSATGAPRPAGVGTAAPDAGALDSALWANLTPTRERRSSANPWLLLGLLVVVLLVAMVVLALVAAHLAHTHPAGTSPAAVGAVLSRLRL